MILNIVIQQLIDYLRINEIRFESQTKLRS